jgi:hypothetical protein
MANDITKNNIRPFIDINKVIDFSNDKKKLSHFFYGVPYIPELYFNNNKDKGVDIDKYNEIRIYLKEMETIKDFILSILKTSKYEIEKINVSKKKYKLYKYDLLLSKETYMPPDMRRFLFEIKGSDKNQYTSYIEDTFDKTFVKNKFGIFLEEYTKKKYNILLNANTEHPYFYHIFQKEYSGKPKQFFIKLFKKYINIRKKITESIQTYNGIIGFDMVFEINDNLIFDRIKNIEKDKIKKNKKNEINYNKYTLLGENIINNEKEYKYSKT